MANPPRKKGTAFESLICGYLQRFWPEAHRLAPQGAHDKGDIGGMPIVLELKNEKRTDLAGWMGEAKREAERAGQVRYAVVHKRRGVSEPAEQYVSMPLWMLVDLLIGDGVIA